MINDYKKLEPYLIKKNKCCDWCRKLIKYDFEYKDNKYFCSHDCKKKYYRYFERMEKKYKDLL